MESRTISGAAMTYITKYPKFKAFIPVLNRELNLPNADIGVVAEFCRGFAKMSRLSHDHVHLYVEGIDIKLPIDRGIYYSSNRFTLDSKERKFMKYILTKQIDLSSNPSFQLAYELIFV